MERFTDKPLLVLQEISAQHRPITKQDLEKLKQQIDMALSIPESEMRRVTPEDMARGVTRYGTGAVCIGDFVVKRR